MRPSTVAADKETPPCSVYGIDNLRIADGSITPRVTTGNTMAPCVIVGEKAARLHQERGGS